MMGAVGQSQTRPQLYSAKLRNASGWEFHPSSSHYYQAGATQMSLADDPTRKQSAMTLGPSGYSASTPLSSNPGGLRVWSEGYLSWFD